MHGRAANLGLLTVAVVTTLSVWFAGAAAVPALLAQGLISPARGGWLSACVQLGFVAGTLGSALLALPDRLPPRLLFAGGALVGAAATAAQVGMPPDGDIALLCRFIAGAAMAGVYPVGMKLAAGWARGDLGLMVGLVVGALTLGSALPHLLGMVGGAADWRAVYLWAGALAGFGGLLILPFRLGSPLAPAPPLRPAAVLLAWRDPALRNANLGYLGHMWELYAMWAWIGLLLREVLGAGPGAMATFAVVAAGAPACIVAGWLADRGNHAGVAACCMLGSAACAIVLVPALMVHPLLGLGVALVWGGTVVADSAQFSACTVLLAPAPLVGTMLTAQVCLGFLLTAATIPLFGLAQQAGGWWLACALLAPGPLLGAWRMRRLMPDVAQR